MADEPSTEEAYLMRSPANDRRLRQAIEQLEAGRGVEHELIDVDDEPSTETWGGTGARSSMSGGY